MLAWILEANQQHPGFLIGGVPNNFSVSATVGTGECFVIEADEYDTAFFDKRSKFVHYRPTVAILNNLEFDHADIFDDVAAIQKQFHHLVRIVPSNGLIIVPKEDNYLTQTLSMGCWTRVETTGMQKNGDWSADNISEDGSQFDVLYKNILQGRVRWELTGQHSVMNALAAIAAAHFVNITAGNAIEALNKFQSVKRRMEVVDVINGITIYDDFAHHPTAINTTLQGLRAKVKNARIIAIIEPRSNTMKLGVHKTELAHSCSAASEVCWYQPSTLGWDLQPLLTQSDIPAKIFNTIDNIIAHVVNDAQPGDHVVIMSNGGFEGIHQKMATALKEKVLV
jgi:UDP-N-acetylmuramate: L-alanyl-gamma-D-glutamyl-meso-diaminopimelate ligase